MDYRITEEDFIENKAYSAWRFFEHAAYFLKHKPRHVEIEYFRQKVVMQSTTSGKKIVVKCHCNGRSRHYLTIFTPTYKELCTLHDSTSPQVVKAIIEGYLVAV